MVEIQVEENEENIEYETDEVENLLFSIRPEHRVFVLANKNETTLLGMLDSETEDSFLVLFPSRMVQREDNNYEIVPYMEVPFLRLMKSQVIIVAPIMEPFSSEFACYLDKTSGTMDSAAEVELGKIEKIDTPSELETYLNMAYQQGRILIEPHRVSTRH